MKFDLLFRRTIRPTVVQLFYPPSGTNIWDREHLGVVNELNRSTEPLPQEDSVFTRPKTKAVITVDEDDEEEEAKETAKAAEAPADGEKRKEGEDTNGQGKNPPLLSTVAPRPKLYLMPYKFLTEWRAWVKRPAMPPAQVMKFKDVSGEWGFKREVGAGWFFPHVLSILGCAVR